MLPVQPLLDLLARRRAHDVAVDLGTARVRVFAHGRGLVADEPSVVHVRRNPLALVSVGALADTQGQGAECGFPVRPLRDGVVRDVECAGWLLSAMLRRARGLSLVRPTVLACAPSDATPDEIEALREALRRAGAARATVVPEPLAAAVGVGLDLASPHAQILVDVGEGVTDVALLRNGLLEETLAVRVGCSSLRAAVMDHVTCLLGVVPSEAAVEDLVRRMAPTRLPVEAEAADRRADAGAGSRRESGQDGEHPAAIGRRRDGARSRDHRGSGAQDLEPPFRRGLVRDHRERGVFHRRRSVPPHAGRAHVTGDKPPCPGPGESAPRRDPGRQPHGGGQTDAVTRGRESAGGEW